MNVDKLSIINGHLFLEGFQLRGVIRYRLRVRQDQRCKASAELTVTLLVDHAINKAEDKTE